VTDLFILCDDKTAKPKKKKKKVKSEGLKFSCATLNYTIPFLSQPKPCRKSSCILKGSPKYVNTKNKEFMRLFIIRYYSIHIEAVQDMSTASITDLQFTIVTWLECCTTCIQFRYSTLVLVVADLYVLAKVTTIYSHIVCI
jgi:hypothetical protein